MDGSSDSRNSGTKSELNNSAGEAARGGADAVNDTPGLARHGTTPGSQFEVVSEQSRSPTGNRLIWLALVVALGIILGYAAGMLR